MTWFSAALAVFEKDLRIELRTRYALNTLLLFVVSAVLVTALAVQAGDLTPQLRSALLWIIILFSAVAGLSQVFVSEEAQGTVLLLQLNATPSAVYTGKLLYNLFLTVLVHLMAGVTFALILGVDQISTVSLAILMLLGAVGLAAATTLLSALIAKASNRGPLFAVLAFPVLVPLLMTVVGGTSKVFEGERVAELSSEIAVLVGYAGVLITASLLLFDYIWHD